MQAAVLRQMIDEQVSLQDTILRRPAPVDRLHRAAIDVIRGLAEAIRYKKVVLDIDPFHDVSSQALINRRWFRWFDGVPQSEVSSSPLRELHARDTDGQPPSMPQWKYVPAGEGARLLAQLRHGRCMFLADTAREAQLRWGDPHLVGQTLNDGLCSTCRVADTAHHLGCCLESTRRHARVDLLREWVIPLGIEDPTPEEVVAILVGEAPHRCHGAFRGMDPRRRARWRMLFHTHRRARKRFGAHLAKTLVRMLHPYSGELDSGSTAGDLHS